VALGYSGSARCSPAPPGERPAGPGRCPPPPRTCSPPRPLTETASPPKGEPILALAGDVGPGKGVPVSSGYTVVTADSLDEAVALAATCPLLARGGGIEVGVVR
jgi:hypothetical protein